MEDAEKRLKRLEDGPPLEIIETLLNSIHNFYLRETSAAIKAGTWDLAFIGTHSVASIIGAGLFGDRSMEASFRRFLKEFVDTDEPGGNFSDIAKELNDWRHVLIHRWLSKMGHEFGFDTDQIEGWRRVDGVLLVNPVRLNEAVANAFALNGKLWQWRDVLSDAEAQAAKTRLLELYRR